MRTIILGIIVVAIIIGIFIYWGGRQDNEEHFMNEHNAKEIYEYRSEIDNRYVPYIPEYLIKEKNGAESSYSFWVYLNGYQWNYKYGDWKHIWHRGTNPSLGGISNMRPGFWILPTINKIVCVYTTTEGQEKMYLDDVELNKWIQIVVVLRRNNVSLYRNGLLEESRNLNGNLIMSKDNIYVNYYGGYAGSISDLIFYDIALNPDKIQEKYKIGKRKFDKITKNYIQNTDSDTNTDIMPICPDDKCPVK